MMARQGQKGGDNSTNIQTEHMVMQVGIDERRAREVFQEMNLQLKKEYTQEALNIANERVSEFENSLISKMEQVDGALEAFADPSFQLLVIEAQKTAASTERPADYDLLSELLVHRFQKGENRIVRAGISRAVEVVDEISDDALIGLTAFHAVNLFLPVTGDIYQGLDVLDDLFGKIFYGSLPVGRDWLDHLDILNAVRLSSFNGLKKIEQYYSEQLSGYIDAGIEKKSEDYDKAVELLKINNLPQDLLVEHALNRDFMRIPILNKQKISSLKLIQKKPHEGGFVDVSVALSEKQIEVISAVYDLYNKNGNLKIENTSVFIENWDKRANLKTLKAWWDGLDIGIQITSVGKVLAHSNAQRCDNNLPPLD